jgi:HAD superfamily hydrolase (TIGR01484 family)
MSGYLLCTDLDRTLLPNGTQPESEHARQLFSWLIGDSKIHLAYVTGRDPKRVRQAIASYRIPQPHFVVSDVGTRIYHLQAGEWQDNLDWQRVIAPSWQGKNQREVAQLLTGMKELRRQEPSRQSTLKLSFYVPLYVNREQLGEQILAVLRTAGIGATLVWSDDEPTGVGLLDILPERASKLGAVEFLREQLEIPLRNTLFCGDGTSDLQLLISPVPAVLVANAVDAVKAGAAQAATRLGQRDALYLAHGGFLGMNGNYAAGILEGIAHFFPDLGQRLEQQTRDHTGGNPR